MPIFMLTPKDMVEKKYRGYDSVEPFVYQGVEHPNEVVVTFATGRVLYLREANYSDDSDFYATYMTNEGEFVEVCYGTTRGWSYANGAIVDATPEVREAYRRCQRSKAAESKLRMRRERSARIKAAGITFPEYLKLQYAIPEKRAFDGIMDILTTAKGGFRKSLADQVRAWLASDNAHPTPLSRKQINAMLNPPWRNRYY